MDKDEIDVNKLSEKYGNKTKQLANWLKSLRITDYGYNYLKKEGYSEEQIAPWVRRTPREKVKKKSSSVKNDENLMKDGVTGEDEDLHDENLMKKDESPMKNDENGEDEMLKIPKPLRNKGTQSSDTLQSSPNTRYTKLHNLHLPFMLLHPLFMVKKKSSLILHDENNSSSSLHLEELTPQQLEQFETIRGGNGDIFCMSSLHMCNHFRVVHASFMSGILTGYKPLLTLS